APVRERARRAQRRGGGHPRDVPRDARGRRGRAGLPRRRARHEQALQGALQAPALRHRLHAPRPRGAGADRAGGGRRLGGAAARARELAPRGGRARHARLPGDADLPVARAAGAAAAAREVPDLLRRAAALRRRSHRRGRRDRREGGARAGGDRGALRARARRAAGSVPLSARRRSSGRPRRVFLLGGGASLGAHQVGAMRYLAEQGIVPDAIVGSSVGVLNACLYASGGLARLEEAWASVRVGPTRFRPTIRHNPVTGLSLFSLDGLKREFDRFLDYEAILASPLDLSFIVLNLSRGEGQFVSNRHVSSAADLEALVTAGYSIPILFPPVKHRGEWYVDGGFAWNVPILQAYEMGATEIYVLAVVATELPYQRSFRGFPDYAARLADVLWRTL